MGNSLESLIQYHMQTIPMAHASMESPARAATWLRSAAITGVHAPLVLAHDLGSLICQPRDMLKIEKPAYLPSDIDTSRYLDFLNRLAAHPMFRETAAWNLSDSVIGVILAKLMSDIVFPETYRIPTGSDSIQFAGDLETAIHQSDPKTVWRQTDPGNRPELNKLLPPESAARIESNLRRIEPTELRFLHLYGPRTAGSPDPRDLLDLFSFFDLPLPMRAVMDQVLRLIPKISQETSMSGVQTYSAGGYEGLTRKGSLDSLLPTELAYSKDMFLYRMLNHEALYYGREGEKENKKELAYIITQTGIGTLGDPTVMAQALTLALAQIMERRGYEVRQSFVGSQWTPPETVSKPSDLHRILYYRDDGFLEAQPMLDAVLGQLKRWESKYRRMQVFWVIQDHWDADDWEEYEFLYRKLKLMAGQYAWFIREGKGVNGNRPLAAGMFHRWHVTETELLWEKLEFPVVVTVSDRDIQEMETPKKISDSIGMKFAYIPPGTFMMGSPEDEIGRGSNETLHQVTLTKGFYMQTTQVTEGQWKAIMGSNPSYWQNGKDFPVENLEWDDIQKFIKKLNELEGTNVYRLPTEAEWEYACRAGSRTRFCFGDDENKLSEYAWYHLSLSNKHPVAQLKPNAWGLYDMHGNVLEWCQDWYAEYSNEPVIDPFGPATGSSKVYRGGGNNPADICRSAYRFYIKPDSYMNLNDYKHLFSFRLVKKPLL